MAASQWLARRDRGLSAAEAEAYAKWLGENPAHGAAISRLERAWSCFDRLQGCGGPTASHPNPDLLIVRRSRPWLWTCGLAAAAAVVFGGFVWRMSLPAEPVAEFVAHSAMPTQMTLEDGSLVELNVGAKIETRFGPEQRAVQLMGGEAHFVVAKDASRPFIVSTGDFAVRAVGTSFAVNKSTAGISLMVTEGKVTLNQLEAAGDSARSHRELSSVVAGQHATVRTDGEFAGEPKVEVRSVTAAEMERALAWQTMRLEFVATPLKEIVAKFNRYNSRKLIVEDEATGDIMVGGSFRADNVESFVRLMELGFGVSAESRGDEILLRSR